MINPFKSLHDNTKDEAKKKLHKEIEGEAWTVTKLIMSGQLKVSHIDHLEGLYENYYEKYPDGINHGKSIQRIKQLRQFAK